MQDIELIENIERLKNKYKMSEDLIDSIIYNHNGYHPIAISSLLVNIDNIDEDDRMLDIIDTMHRNLRISYETMAAFGNLSLEEFKEFIKNPSTLNEQKKYKFAIRLMFLHFVFKEKYLIDTNKL
ncbi:HTH domain-containing protein [Heyndrickxia camelliae]|uniref:Uncharacterized protein n=1 Tax=Heyndrickxia camelliae TaxID=1707093 RepID=A0A2N3LCY6_9BACI|nr:HTH domain-containing protein [Heyndrickxia camelliae]PKR82469.1 hypothetical protein CWO92_24330 [Heyndrickxia camelliae]